MRDRDELGGGVSAGGDVVNGCYGNGVFVVALSVANPKAGGNSRSPGENFFHRRF